MDSIRLWSFTCFLALQNIRHYQQHNQSYKDVEDVLVQLPVLKAAYACQATVDRTEERQDALFEYHFRNMGLKPALFGEDPAQVRSVALGTQYVAEYTYQHFGEGRSGVLHARGRGGIAAVPGAGFADM